MDITNADTPQPGGQISGEASRAAAIKRLKALEQHGTQAGSPPAKMIGPPGQKG